MSALPAPTLYEGVVRHARRFPREHVFEYRVYQVLVDLDDLASLAERLGLFSYNGRNVTSLSDRDYMGPSDEPVRAKLDRWLAERGEPRPARAFLLTHLRVLGYVFNPVSFYFCYDAEGRLACSVAEINNTFGEGFAYLLRRPEGTGASHPIAARVAKEFHVSPFFGMDGTYEFAVTPPGETVRTAVSAWGPPAPEGEKRFEGFFAAKGEPLTPRALRRALLRHPLMPLFVMGWIHWHALRLVLKRVPVFTKPGPPAGALYAGGPPRSPFARRSA
jgi:DUF1365 family protein